MRNKLLNPMYILLGVVLGSVLSLVNFGTVSAQSGPSKTSGDALWHLPKFGEAGWFIHAHNGMVRACNMDKASVIGEKQGPRCSNWE